MTFDELLPPRFRRSVPDHEAANDDTPTDVVEVVPEKSFGVRRMEAIAASFTIVDKAVLFFSIFLVAYSRNLDGNGRKSFQATAIAEWNKSANTAMLGVVRSCVAAASLPVYAKISDWFGRSSIFLAIVTFYVVGTIIQATSKNFETYTGGYILYILGFAGEHAIFQILIGDLTSLRSRLIFAYVPTLPQLINTWVSGTIAERILDVSTWRWGFAMWAIIMPAVAVPLFWALYSAEYRSKKKGLLNNLPSTRTIISTPAYWKDFFWKADLVGLFLLAGSWALLLIPLTLGGGTTSKWKTARVLTPLFVGVCVTFPSFVVWESKFSRYPLLPWKLLKSRHILASFGLALFSTISQSVQSSYLYYTLIVSFGKSVEAATRTANVESFCETIVGVLVGLAVRRVRVLKPFIMFGACLYVVAYALLFTYRGGHTQADFAGLVGGEVVLGIAGGFSLTPVQVGLQASVGHEKMAVITALFLTAFTTGSAIGSTVAGAIWTNTLPGRLAANLEAIGTANATTFAKQVYGNPLKFVQQNPVGTPKREAVELAYRSVQKSLCTAGICLSAVMVILACLLTWVTLDDRQSHEEVGQVEDLEDVDAEKKKAVEAGRA